MNKVNEIINNKLFIDKIQKLKLIEKDRIFCKHGIEHLLDVARIAYIKNLEEKLGYDKEVIYGAALLHDLGRVQYETVGDEEAMEAFFKLSRYEGIIPAIESSHAVAYAMRKAREMKQGSILVCLSGRGDKDIDYVVEHYGYGEQFL